jgi:hypothetical protein
MTKSFSTPSYPTIGAKGSGDTQRDLRLDIATHTLQTIDYAHHEIHAGSHFMYTDSVELDTSGTQDYLIITPDTTKWAHMMFDMDASAIAMFQLYEDSTHTSTDTQTAGNNNRNSTDSATTLIYKGSTTDTSDGTLIHAYKGGSATNQSRSASLARNDSEIILKQDTTYTLRFTSYADNNLFNLRLEWYEHTDRT